MGYKDADVDQAAYEQWQRRETEPGHGGYNQRAAAYLLSSVREREASKVEGDWHAVDGLVDYDRAWKRPKVNRDALTQYIDHEDGSLADLEMDEVEARIRDRMLKGKNTAALENLRHCLIALRRFAGELNNKYDEKPRIAVLVTVGPARRGICRVCGVRIEGGRAWFLRGEVWCDFHLVEEGVMMPSRA